MDLFITKENKALNEKYYFLKHKSGLNLTVIPKDLPTKYAFVCCNFGAADLDDSSGGVKRSLPPGTAHFLEHKMFEARDGHDSFLDFEKFGGSANAYTSFENTCYFFSCSDNFNENLRVLLSAVSGAHFTKRSVDRERRIITREISMYDDTPSANLSHNLMNALYRSHPITKKISGTAEGIKQITKPVLMQAFKDFYVPENLSLAVCGKIDKDLIVAAADEFFPASSAAFRPTTLFPDEPETVVRQTVTEQAPAATNLYSVGFKCVPSGKDDIEAMKRGYAMRIALTLVFGRSSDFYCKNYEKGVLNERFYAGFTQTRGTAFMTFSGAGDDPGLIAEMITEELESRRKTLFGKEEFAREKKATYADSLALFDIAEDLTAAYAADVFDGYDEFDCIEALKALDYDYICETFRSTASTAARAISVITPTTDERG